MSIDQHSKPGAIIIEGHVQGLSNTRALGEAGIPVIVVDTADCVARYSRYCRGFYTCPEFGSDDLAGFLIDLARDKGLYGWLLLPSNDHAVLTLSRNIELLKKHFKVITPGLEIFENIYDKGQLLEVAKKADVSIPKTAYADCLNEFMNSLSFPVLIRGRFGLDFYRTTGRKAFLASNIKELGRQLFFVEKAVPLQHILIQELIPDDRTNKTVSFTAFCVDGDIKTYWMGEKLREHPIRFGTATFARSVYVKGCYTQSLRLLKAFDYTGVCEVEYLKDPRDGQYKLIELNARTWLWVGLAKACGVDFAKMVYNYMNGLDIVYPKNYEINVSWINPFTDTFYAVQAIWQRRLKATEYFRSLFNREKINALFAKGDWKPGFFYLFGMLDFLKNR